MAGRVLVFGSSGQVARELAGTVWTKGTVLTFLDRNAADFSVPDRLGATVRRLEPDAVIVAAAYTAVDRAEDDEAAATIVNADAPAAIARAAAALSIPVIHFSTDYVFDGLKGSAYEETDAVGPINAYGRSKLAGEIAVRHANSRHLILRTSWLYSAEGANFLRTMLRLASRQDSVSVVADQWGCPTAAPDLARAVARILPRVIAGDAEWGTYHLAGASAASWHGFAETIFRALAERGLRRPRNRQVTTVDYPTPARRPPDSRLSSERFRLVFGPRLPGFEESVPAVLNAALARAED
ncbi:MAG TPA: dTDP-4-dehydrorhamnose reductase [Propylenella sp.]